MSTCYYIHILNVLDFLFEYKNYKSLERNNQEEPQVVQNKKDKDKEDEKDKKDKKELQLDQNNEHKDKFENNDEINVKVSISDADYVCKFFKLYKFSLSLAAYNNLLPKHCGIIIQQVQQVSNPAHRCQKFQVRFLLNTMSSISKLTNKGEIQEVHGIDQWNTKILYFTNSKNSKARTTLTKVLELLSQNITYKIEQIIQSTTKPKVKATKKSQKSTPSTPSTPSDATVAVTATPSGSTTASKLLELFTTYDNKICDEIYGLINEHGLKVDKSKEKENKEDDESDSEKIQEFMSSLKASQATFNRSLVNCAMFFLGPDSKNVGIYAFVLNKLFRSMKLTPYACLVECNQYLTEDIDDDLDLKNSARLVRLTPTTTVYAIESKQKQFKTLTFILANVLGFWELDRQTTMPLEEVEKIASALLLQKEIPKLQKCISYIKQQVHLRKSSLHVIGYYIIKKAVTCKFFEEWCSL